MRARISLLTCDLILYILFLALILPVSIAWLRYGCLPAYDMGIFTEVLQAAWRFEWDPYLTVRESYVIQDHWDPITLMIGYSTWPLSFLVSAPAFLLWFEPTIIFVAAAYLRRALLARGFSEQRAWLAFASVLFARVTWNALSFPVHPAAWALLPQLGLVIWFYDFFLGQRRQEILSYLCWSLFLWTCGEQFSVALVAANFILLLVAPRRRLEIFGLLLVSVGMAWWSLYGRIHVHGSIFDHPGRVSFNLFVVWAKYKFDSEFFRRLGESLLAFILPMLLIVQEIRRLGSSHLSWLQRWNSLRFPLVVCAFISPLLLGRLLSNSWGFHYGMIVAGFFGMGFFLNKNFSLSKRRANILVVLCLLSSIGDWGKAFHLAVDPAPSCSATTRKPTDEEWAQRQRDMESISKVFLPATRLMAGMYLVPTLQYYRSDLTIHSLGLFTQDPPIQIEALWLPRAPFDNHWPVSSRQADQLLLELKPSAIDERPTSVLLWGPFSSQVFDKYQQKQTFIYR